MKIDDMTEIQFLKVLVKIHLIDFECQKNITNGKIHFFSQLMHKFTKIETKYQQCMNDLKDDILLQKNVQNNIQNGLEEYLQNKVLQCDSQNYQFLQHIDVLDKISEQFETQEIQVQQLIKTNLQNLNKQINEVEIQKLEYFEKIIEIQQKEKLARLMYIENLEDKTLVDMKVELAQLKTDLPKYRYAYYSSFANLKLYFQELLNVLLESQYIIKKMLKQFFDIQKEIMENFKPQFTDIFVEDIFTFDIKQFMINREKFDIQRLEFDNYQYHKQFYDGEIKYYENKINKYMQNVSYERKLLINLICISMIQKQISFGQKFERYKQILLQNEDIFLYALCFLRIQLLKQNDKNLNYNNFYVKNLIKSRCEQTQNVSSFEVYTLFSVLLVLDVDIKSFQNSFFYDQNVFFQIFEFFILFEKKQHLKQIGMASTENLYGMIRLKHKSIQIKQKNLKIEMAFNVQQNLLINVIQRIIELMIELKYEFPQIINKNNNLIDKYFNNKKVFKMIYYYNKNLFLQFLSKNQQDDQLFDKLKNVNKLILTLKIVSSQKFIDLKDLWSLNRTNKKIKQNLNNIFISSVFSKFLDQQCFDFKIKKQHPNFRKLSSQDLKQIEKDVNRTFESNKNQKTIITRVLIDNFSKIEFDYFQGFNYIVGFFICNSYDENFVKQVCYQILSQNYFILDNDLNKITYVFYVFEKAIKIYMDDLYKHFQYNEIKLDQIFISYFITCYCNCYSYKDKSNFHIVKQILMLFLEQSWIGIIKLSLYLLSIHEKYLIQFNQEQIMIYFNKITTQQQLFGDRDNENQINIFRKIQKYQKLNSFFFEHNFQFYQIIDQQNTKLLDFLCNQLFLLKISYIF